MKKLGLVGLLTVAVLSASEIPNLTKSKTNHIPLTNIVLETLSDVVKNKENDTQLVGWWYACKKDGYKLYHEKIADEFEREDYFSTSYKKLTNDVQSAQGYKEKTFMIENIGSLGKYNFKEGYFPVSFKYPELKFNDTNHMAFFKMKFDNYDVNNQRIYMDKANAKEFRESIKKSAKRGLPIRFKYTFTILDAKVSTNSINEVKKDTNPHCDPFRIDAKAHISKIEFENAKDESIGSINYN